MNLSFTLSAARRPRASGARWRPRAALAATLCAGTLAAGCLLHAAAAQATNITTYHADPQRTGWNSSETILNTKNVNSTSFGLLHQVAVDDFVEAQPLVVTGLTIGGGTHDVVYVATQTNYVYAIDATTGAKLATRQLATPVPISMLPGQCNNNGGTVGINSTPVIDVANKTMYVVSYELHSNLPTFRVHELDLATLGDKITPRTVTASQTLSDNKTVYKFDPANQRQRAALLLANGNVYAAFGSFCDNHPGQSRGWLLGWKAGTLTPLASHLNNKRISAPNNWFLSSIWMSGYGISTDFGGNVFFVTGNADPSGTSYDSTLNLAESVVKMKPDLTQVLSFFTPSGTGGNSVGGLDQNDNDFGSGGVMIVPNAPTQPKGLAVAAGKVGQMYLMDRGQLGGYNGTGPNRVLGTYGIQSCFCGPSFFVAANGHHRIVSSGGNLVKAWQINSTTLAPEPGSFAPIANGQDGGFFTFISSNGTTAGSALIWAVNHPQDSNPGLVHLYAFDGNATASNTQPLFSAVAGSWPLANHNSNTVPVAANGKVYVATHQALYIFGPNGKLQPTIAPPPPPPRNPSPVEVFGKITTVTSTTITIVTAGGTALTVNTADAQAAGESPVLVVGRAVAVKGAFLGGGVVHADSILHVKDDPAFWTP